MEIRIALDKKQLKQIERELAHIPRGMQAAVSRAINKTGRTAKKEIAQTITKTYLVKSSDIKKAVSFEQATRNSLVGRLSSPSSAAVPLESFRVGATGINPRPSVGVKARVRKDRKLRAIPGAFITKSFKSGKKWSGIYIREGSKRMPVKKLFGLTPSHMMEIVTRGQYLSNLDKTLDKNLTHEVDFILNGGGKLNDRRYTRF